MQKAIGKEEEEKRERKRRDRKGRKGEGIVERERRIGRLRHRRKG